MAVSYACRHAQSSATVKIICKDRSSNHGDSLASISIEAGGSPCLFLSKNFWVMFGHHL